MKKTVNFTYLIVTVLAILFAIKGHINWYVASLFIVSTCEITWTRRVGWKNWFKALFNKAYHKEYLEPEA